jgi:hypothetical protein
MNKFMEWIVLTLQELEEQELVFKARNKKTGERVEVGISGLYIFLALFLMLFATCTIALS